MRSILSFPASSNVRALSRRHRRAWLPFFCGVLGAFGCSSPDLSGPGTTDPAQLVWKMQLNTRAILMSTAAPYDTLQLTAVPSTVSGIPLPGAPPVTFMASPDSTLRVSSTGLLTARGPTNLSYVIATIVYRGIRVSDTAWVNVTNETSPPTFQQLQLQLQPGDSAKMSAQSASQFPSGYGTPGKSLVVGALDATQANIPHSLVALQTSDPLLALVYDVNPLSVGGALYPIVETVYSPVLLWPSVTARDGKSVTVYASATVYGVTRQDSLPILITPKIYGAYIASKSIGLGSNGSNWTLGIANDHMVIAVGGYIVWQNYAPVTDSLDVVFDDPTAASPELLSGRPDSLAGNIALFRGDSSYICSAQGDVCRLESFRSRQFLRAGTFPWHSPRTGLSGTIIVR